ncbi:hypothetical protein [Streptomyces sp. NPDC001205]
MSDTQQTPPEDSGLTIVSAEDIKPEDVGTLSVRYVDGTPEFVLTDGKAIPNQIRVVDASGQPVALYETRPLQAAARYAGANALGSVFMWTGDLEHGTLTNAVREGAGYDIER